MDPELSLSYERKQVCQSVTYFQREANSWKFMVPELSLSNIPESVVPQGIYTILWNYLTNFSKMDTEFHWTLYHTIPIFNDPEEEDFWKHCGKRRRCCKPAFSPFPTMFSTLHKTNFSFKVIFILLSANALNLDQSKILSSGNGLMGAAKESVHILD